MGPGDEYWVEVLPTPSEGKPVHRTPQGTTWAAFAGAVVIGGANFIAVSVSNEALAPLYGAALRFAAAAFLFLLLLRVRGVPLARGRPAAGAVAYGVLGFGLTYGFLYHALLGLPAGTASVVVASTPLFTLLFAVLVGQERLSYRGVGGGLLAIAGIGVLSLGTADPAPGAGLALSYLAFCVLGTAAAAASSVVAKALPEVHPLNMNAIGMIAGSLCLALGSLAMGEPWVLPREGRTWVAVGWLVILGSVGLFQLFLYVIRRWTASATVYAITGMPLVAVVLGALILGQPITAEVVAGGGLVIAAVYVGARPASRGERGLPSLDPVAPRSRVR